MCFCYENWLKHERKSINEPQVSLRVGKTRKKLSACMLQTLYTCMCMFVVCSVVILYEHENVSC